MKANKETAEGRRWRGQSDGDNTSLLIFSMTADARTGYTPLANAQSSHPTDQTAQSARLRTTTAATDP